MNVELSNGLYLYIAGGVVAIFVLLQSVVFLRKAWKRGLELGVPKERMRLAAVQSGVFSIVPSIPIVLALVALAPTMGVPFSWIRLSVIGSMSYEVTAASAVAGSGIAAMTPSVYAAAMWVMTIGILAGPLFNIFFLKKYQGKMRSMYEKNSKWTEILITAIFMGIIATLGGQQIARGGAALLTLIASALIMLLIAGLSKVFKQKWLEDFALPVAVLGSLALSTIFVTWF